MIASTKFQLLWSHSLLILNNALNRSVQTNGRIAKKIQNVSQPFKIVKLNADQRSHAGLFAFQEKEVKLLLMLPNVPKPITAFQASFLQLTLLPNENNWVTPLHVLKRNAPANGPTAKKTQNVCLPSKTVKRNAELSHRAGLSAYQPREVKPPSISPSVLKPMDASEWCPLLNHAWLNHASLNKVNVFLTGLADNLSWNAESQVKHTISKLNAYTKNQRREDSFQNGITVLVEASAYDWSINPSKI